MYKDSCTVVKDKYLRGQSDKYSAGASREFDHVRTLTYPNVAILCGTGIPLLYMAAGTSRVA